MIGHDDVGMDDQALFFYTKFEAINNDVLIPLPVEKVNPFHQRHGNEVWNIILRKAINSTHIIKIIHNDGLIRGCGMEYRLSLVL